jgi:Tfp pilus assembly protein PilN
MRAVNLIPGEARGSRGISRASFGPSSAVLGLLAVALALVTFYVLTSNTISSRQAQLASVQAQVTQAQAQVGLLGNYGSFVKLAQARAQTVRQIASGRFDWHAALSDLARVVPANTSLQSLLGTAAPGASVSGAGGSASTGALRGNGAGPAFELKGCTKTQDDVARLISRLRLINGVQRVSLADATRADSSPGGSAPAPSAATGGASGASVGCGADAPTFDLVILFRPLAGATATAASPTGAASSPTAAPAASAPGTTK